VSFTIFWVNETFGFGSRLSACFVKDIYKIFEEVSPMIFVIKNEQHALFEEQVQLLRDQFGTYIEYPVPAHGWTLEEMQEHIAFLYENADVVIFASPIPYMIKSLARYNTLSVYVFHNDKREKKVLPDGRVIQTVASTGWQLV
jgi:hypothetical protein